MTDKSTFNGTLKSEPVEGTLTHPGKISHFEDLLKNETIAAHMARINSEIEKFLVENKGEPTSLYEAATHLLRAGGKRLRSLLMILSCEAVGGDVENILPFAVAVELMQTASLLHDDIIDDDPLRRGVTSVHQKYGIRMAVLAGDLLVAHAVRLVGKNATPEMLQNIGSIGIKMCEGEARDYLLASELFKPYSKTEYLDMVRLKTASFMKGAAQIGVQVGKGNDKQEVALSKYAESLGLAFQIRDDTLDVIATQEDMGKPILSDIVKKRGNYVIIEALESCSEQERQDCVENIEHGSVDGLLSLIEKTGAIDRAIEQTEYFVEEAKNAIKGFDFKNQHLLTLFANFVSVRLH